MQNAVPMQVIAHIRSDFPSKFGIPRQSGLVDAPKLSLSRHTAIQTLFADWRDTPTSG